MTRTERVGDPVLEMVLSSARLTAFAGGPGEIRRIVDAIEDAWLEVGRKRVHLEVHRASEPRATIVFQPGSGAHARVYFLMAGLFARRGYNVLPATAPPLLLLAGAMDRAIPAWATRFFAWWSGLRDYHFQVLPGCGHLLFHDHLDVSVPLVSDWLDHKLATLRCAR